MPIKNKNHSIKGRGPNWLEYLIPKPSLWLFPIFYLQVIALAELLTNLREARTGLIIHGITLIVLLIHGAFENDVRDRRFLLALALVPLIRLLSLSLPLTGRPLIDWYLVIGVVLSVAAFFTTRVTDLTAKRIGLTFESWPFQIIFGITGIGFGFLEYLILKPDPLINEFTFDSIWRPALVLILFTGVLEEVIFRGLIQQASLATYGRFGITFVAILFAILHVGYKSFLDVVFVLVIAMIFGLVVQRTGSLLGVSISHSLTNICLFLVFPFVIGTPTLGVPEVVPQTPIPSTTPTQLQKYFFETPTSTITPFYLETELSKTPESPTETAIATQESTKTPTQEIEAQTPTQICGKPRGWVIYVVQSGDTLFTLSQTYNVSVSDLQNANCLGTSTLIIAGDRLYVPNVVTNTPIPSDTAPPTSTTAPSPSSTFTLTTTSTEIPTGTATPSETPTISPTP